MADQSYRVVDSFRTVETFGGLDSVDVQRVIVQTLETGVAFSVQFTANQKTFDDPDALSRATAAIAGPYSGYVNEAMADPHVTGIYAYDDFNASNQQEQRWVVTIVSDSGNTSTQRDLPFIDIRPERFPPIMHATVASLNALEGPRPEVGA